MSLSASTPEFHNKLFASLIGHFWLRVVKLFSINQPPGPWNACDHSLAHGKSSSCTAGRKRKTAYPLPDLSSSGFQNLSSWYEFVCLCGSATFDSSPIRVSKLFERFNADRLDVIFFLRMIVFVLLLYRFVLYVSHLYIYNISMH